MLLLRKFLLPLLRSASPLTSALHHRACLLLLLSTSASAAPISLEDYLVAACGLAPAQARKASKKALDEASKASKKAFEELSSFRLNPACDPDAILALLSGVGLSRDDIAAVVAADPLILRSSVKNIGPRLLALRDRIGLSAPQIARFLLVGSRALRGCDISPKLEFLISFYGSYEQVLVAVKRHNSILMSSLERVIKPNIALLRQCGLSVRDIVQMCSRNGRVLVYNQESLKAFVLRAEELGVPRSSRMFKHALSAVACASEKKVAAKLEFLKMTLGCSKTEAAIAVSKVPSILGFSDDCLLPKIEFLINEVGMEPQYIVERPVLFTLSLGKRLVPRHSVMKVLQAKGLLKCNMKFCALSTIGEATFKLKFIDRHKDSVTGLADAYASARAGGVPPEVQL